MPKAPKNNLHGWLILNKPLGITSADAVYKVKKLIHPSKIGHAGTLDPLATGVLPLALGEGTKCINLLMDAKKTYEFEVAFGERRATGDAEGEVVATSSHRPSEAELRAVLPRFIGPIQQVPPVYSALKIDGKRAYELARAGEEVEMKPRPVTIHALELLGAGGGKAQFRATVSKGTYIRSLGQDLAQAAGSEGYISRLHRSAVGPFTDQGAISLDFLASSVHNAAPSGASPWLEDLSTALDGIPALALDSGQLSKLRHGQRIPLAPLPDANPVGVLSEGKLVALARIEGNHLIPVRLLHVPIG